MVKPTLVQSLFSRPSQSYSYPSKKDYHSTKPLMVRIAAEAHTSIDNQSGSVPVSNASGSQREVETRGRATARHGRTSSVSPFLLPCSGHSSKSWPRSKYTRSAPHSATPNRATILAMKRHRRYPPTSCSSHLHSHRALRAPSQSYRSRRPSARLRPPFNPILSRTCQPHRSPPRRAPPQKMSTTRRPHLESSPSLVHPPPLPRFMPSTWSLLLLPPPLLPLPPPIMAPGSVASQEP